ncbi:MAG: ABC transporter substrate-binding protein [Rhodocyclaceae bacterium]|jgi:TRAP-type mannitol/chloroaromatic compound transport system substrate-binding protein|nr:TRAP transporter substrate-binding protein [Zoogloeaceae bacterium]MCC7270355.1 TRAP transporter substrate-binding protein [Rhodocyclaceae bacterium]MCZ2173875.1 TRAP transporter substrate-binding protein [Burkholderiales bacterium]HNQ57408.1 TRAP transporter substrate-binding protein [Candidatus Desulfobacillus denitrificans]MCQ3925018.1 ABC transporter substrate-binding protein [Rhodocyclaceae bacterium]
MERRKFIKHAGLAGILAAGVAPAAYAQGANIRWRLASSFPKALDTIFGAADVFSKKLKEMSGGKFEISVHAGGELMPPFGVVDGVQQGTVECAHTAPYYFYGKDPTFSLNCAIPFGLNSRQMTAWMYEGNGLKLFREFYKSYNIVNFPMGNTGAQMGGWFRKPIKSVKDMKGLKMRISNLAGEVAARLGVVPQSLPGGELYQALEKGTIDAVEWVGPYDDQKLGFYKVAKNYVYPAWWEGGPELELYVNSKAWESLSPEYKAMLECAAATAHSDMLAKYDAKNPKALKELVASGVKLQRMPKDAMDAAWKAAQEVYADLSAKNANWKKIYDDQIAFRREQNQWFRFAEMGFDSYMQSLKL